MMQSGRLAQSLAYLDAITRPTCSVRHRLSRWAYHRNISTRTDKAMATAAASAPLKKRSVVSSFIMQFPEPGHGGAPRVALFRRSGKVNTYR